MLAKLKQLATDATLRRWLIARVLGRTTSPDPFTPHRPPYLAGIRPPGAEPGTADDRVLRADAPGGALILPLPGENVTLTPGDEAALWDRSFADTETLLAAHRFAWMPILGERADPAWVAALWNAWRARYALPDRSWAWHPYTAAERAVNLLRFFGRHGHPAPAAATRECLAAHAPAIAARLEYFGPHNTGNHLANNGRGLFALGLELRMPAFADIGAKILVEEARRIFSPSGILREGSSHYHTLYARNYTEAWLWARRHGHGAEAELKSIAAHTLAIIPYLCLKGGMPLVGDISPDCTPDHLSAFLPGDPATAGWGALLESDERTDFLALKAQAGLADLATLTADGWLRFDSGDWNGLWHMAPGGWATMPGHGHQDAGSFELHWREMPLFIDLGRGSYGEAGEAAKYRSARVHNGLLLDDTDPYPPNKPYYDDAFRRRERGSNPILVRDATGVALAFGGYGRMGVPSVRRQWVFSEAGFVINDATEGRGRHRIVRRLHTPWPVEETNGAAIVHTPSGIFRVRAQGVPSILRPAVRWTAYGEGAPANAIAFETDAALPWSGAVNVEKL